MITEDYCSYEVAKLLKEKGFDEPCLQMWECGPDTKYLFRLQSSCYQNITEEDSCLAPTHQMAMKWLREVHHLLISIVTYPIYGKVKDEKGRNTCGLLYWDYMASGEWVNEKYCPNQKVFAVSAKCYEEAVEAALKYSLENLI